VGEELIKLRSCIERESMSICIIYDLASSQFNNEERQTVALFSLFASPALHRMCCARGGEKINFPLKAETFKVINLPARAHIFE
jgi:hypothetical protein